MAQSISLSYIFTTDDNKKVDVIEVVYDLDKLNIILPKNFSFSAWVNNFKCSLIDNLSLSEKNNCCKLSFAIDYFLQMLKNIDVNSQALISVRSEERIYSLKGDVKKGLFSVLGLIMSVSDCPYLRFLSPLARFHLPFASKLETSFRSLSSYLVLQYFKYLNKKEPDLEFLGLISNYDNVSKINIELINYIKSNVQEEKLLKALYVLDEFAKSFSHDLSLTIDSIKNLYQRLI